MTYEELQAAYWKQTSVLGGTRSALRKVRESRDRLKSRVDALEALLMVSRMDQVRLNEFLQAINVIQREMQGKQNGQISG